MAWIEYPRMGTTVCPGRWMCTVRTKTGATSVKILTLYENGEWVDCCGKTIPRTHEVVGIDYVPEPYKPKL